MGITLVVTVACVVEHVAVRRLQSTLKGREGVESLPFPPGMGSYQTPFTTDTMAAIVRDEDFGAAFDAPVAPALAGAAVLLDVAPPEFVPNVFRRTWTAVKTLIGANPLLQWCCGSGVDDHFYEYDREVRSQIAKCLLERRQGYAVNGVVEVMREVYEETGYDLGHAAHCYKKYGAVAMTPQERARVQITDAVPRRAPDIPQLETKVIPLFAASMVAHLRAKLGRLSSSEANYLVLQREYLRKCRLCNVRDVDICAHEQHVINAFFSDETFDRVGFGRARASRFRKWVNNDPDSKPAPQFC